jgi:hypothetical protein
MIESVGVERLISVVAGNRRARLKAHAGFLLRGWRRGAATTTKFSSRTSNRSGLEILRGIFLSCYRYFPASEASATTEP